MQKQPFWEVPRVQWGSLIVCIAVLLGGLTGIPIAAVLQRRQTKPAASKAARMVGWITCLAWAAGFGALGIVMQDALQIVLGHTGPLKLVLNLWVVASVLTLGSLVFGILAWRRAWWRPAGRIWFSVIVFAAIGCVLWLNHWNLLGWNY